MSKAPKRSLSRTERPIPRVNGVYERLRKEILSGVMPPGEFLLEEDLADRFKVSRTPLREAFIHLYRDGLLQKGPYKGYVVTEVSFTTYREVFQLRSLLEPAAAKLAAQNPNVASLLELAEQSVERMRSFGGRKLTADEALEAGELDSTFHCCIAQASGNGRLLRYVTELQNVHQFSYSRYPNEPLHETVREHQAILKAIRAGDPTKAEQSTLHHLRQALERAKELFLGENSLGRPWQESV
ncbi:MAG: GntR family transcriptional regulator [Acidobacteriota bacterium]